MPEPQQTGEVIRADISGPTSGQVAVGKGITQSQQTIGVGAAGVTDEDLSILKTLLAQLKTKVEVEAPPEKKGPALERVEELEQAVTAKKPDVTTIEYVRNWFAKNAPALAGAVTAVVANPIVGKIVEAAGEAVAAEFRRRLGTENR